VAGNGRGLFKIVTLYQHLSGETEEIRERLCKQNLYQGRDLNLRSFEGEVEFCTFDRNFGHGIQTLLVVLRQLAWLGHEK
jgi:hypothetical protein